jgi:hypothetical protein
LFTSLGCSSVETDRSSTIFQESMPTSVTSQKLCNGQGSGAGSSYSGANLPYCTSANWSCFPQSSIQVAAIREGSFRFEFHSSTCKVGGGVHYRRELELGTPHLISHTATATRLWNLASGARFLSGEDNLFQPCDSLLPFARCLVSTSIHERSQSLSSLKFEHSSCSDVLERGKSLRRTVLRRDISVQWTCYPVRYGISPPMWQSSGVEQSKTTCCFLGGVRTEDSEPRHK